MHLERHSIERVGWLRAAVLGANDGIVSTASLVLGVASANTGSSGVLLAGIAGLVAGAMSMAAGEYVSVSSQADTENAALAQEKRELETDYQGEVRELTLLYVQRGLEPELAQKVAEQLMVKDALDTHAREELGLTDTNSAPPAGCRFLGAEFFRWRNVAFSRCMAFSSNAGFSLCYSLLPFFTGCSWLYIFNCQQSLSCQGYRQNYFLEHPGDVFVDGNRSSCRAGIVLIDGLTRRKEKYLACGGLKNE